jgi:hypothetical protein
MGVGMDFHLHLASFFGTHDMIFRVLENGFVRKVTNALVACLLVERAPPLLSVSCSLLGSGFFKLPVDVHVRVLSQSWAASV